MRIPKIKVYDTSSEEEVIELGPLNHSSHWYNFSNNKDKDKWIKTTERLVRQSMEMKDLVSDLKMKRGMKFCSFFHKVSRDMAGKVRISIELHHEPFTLYDIVAIVLNEWLRQEKEPNMFQIVDEVVELHYLGMIGLIPVSKTVHDAIGSGKVIVPLQMVDEGFKDFMDKYSDTLADMPALLDVLKAKLELSKEFQKDPEKFISALKKKYIYVVNDGYSSIPDHIE